MLFRSTARIESLSAVFSRTTKSGVQVAARAQPGVCAQRPHRASGQGAANRLARVTWNQPHGPHQAGRPDAAGGEQHRAHSAALVGDPEAELVRGVSLEGEAITKASR